MSTSGSVSVVLEFCVAYEVWVLYQHTVQGVKKSRRPYFVIDSDESGHLEVYIIHRMCSLSDISASHTLLVHSLKLPTSSVTILKKSANSNAIQ